MHITRSDLILAAAVVLLFGWLYTKLDGAEQQALLSSRFVEDLALEDAITACEAADFAVPFRYRTGKSKWVVGLVQQRSRADGSVMPFLQLHADGLDCSYSPLGKRAVISD